MLSASLQRAVIALTIPAGSIAGRSATRSPRCDAGLHPRASVGGDLLRVGLATPTFTCPTRPLDVALVGVLGQYPQKVESIMKMLKHVAPQSTVSTLEGTLAGIVKNKGGAGALLGIGIVVALWSASGYVGAFTRSSNKIHGVQETRPFWKLRPQQVLIAATMVLASAFIAVGYVFTGSLGSVIVFLVWLWIGNVAILLGVQFNAERLRKKD